MSKFKSRTKTMLNLALTGQESEISEQTSIKKSANVSENASENNIHKDQNTESIFSTIILREHNYYSGQENDVVPTGTGTLELPFEELEEILQNNAPSLTMDTSLVEVPNIIFEMEEGLLLDCNLNNSNNNQSEIEDDRQGELGEYQREDSAEKEIVEDVQQELNITIEDRNELAEEKGEEATEYVEQIADEGNNARDQDGDDDHDGMEQEGEGADDVRGGNQGRKKKGRKRKHPEQNRDLRKQLKNSNKQYINQKGETVFPKAFRDYHCNCKCNEKVSVERRISIFNKFYNLSDYNSQTMFICSQVSEKNVKRKRAINSEKRKFSREYHLNSEIVCKEIFRQTLRISSNRINTALKKIKKDDMVDKRGSHGGYNKLEDHKTDEVILHINSFPKYKSHYCRSSTETSFLPTDMTLAKMYDLYSQSYENPVSKSKYAQVFYKNFNLKRKALKKDTCSTCDSFEAKIQSTNSNEEKEKIQADRNTHFIAVEKARKQMKNDLKAASESDKMETLTFDLQKTLPLPRIPTNIVYYKRQIMLYNCGIHSGKSNKGYFNVWVEGTAGRGAQEVASCVKKHVLSECENVEELVLWADSCGGQNRNIKMTVMLKHILQNHPTLKKITLRFPIPGHSFLPNDSEFGDVECHLRTHQRLYTDDDYINVMKTCRKRNLFVVRKMEKAEFCSTSALEKSIVNRKKDTSGEKINWFSFREIEVRKAQPFSIFFKTEFEHDHKEIDLTKKVQNRVSNMVTLLNSPLPLLWPQGKPISTAKLDDLKSMFHLIPCDVLPFYQAFNTNANVVDDIDGFNINNNLDFELEYEDD